MIKGIIFDYGGTLDTGGDHWSEVIWQAYQEAQIDIDKPTFREAYVYAERELARTLHILPHHNFHDLLLIKMQIELQWLAENQKFPPQLIQEKAQQTAQICYEAARSWIEKARPVLEKLAEKFPMVLVSNFYGNVETVLKDFDIDKYFTKVIESAVVGVRKPDPEIFRMGVRALGLKPEEVLVVGDSYRKDILPAESIGCQVRWIKGKGWTKEEDAQMHPNIIAQISDLLALLSN